MLSKALYFFKEVLIYSKTFIYNYSALKSVFIDYIKNIISHLIVAFLMKSFIAEFAMKWLQSKMDAHVSVESG